MCLNQHHCRGVPDYEADKNNPHQGTGRKIEQTKRPLVIRSGWAGNIAIEPGVGAHINASRIDLDELRDDRDEVVLQRHARVTILYKAGRKADDVSLHTHTCHMQTVIFGTPPWHVHLFARQGTVQTCVSVTKSECSQSHNTTSLDQSKLLQ